MKCLLCFENTENAEINVLREDKSVIKFALCDRCTEDMAKGNGHIIVCRNCNEVYWVERGHTSILEITDECNLCGGE